MAVLPISSDVPEHREAITAYMEKDGVWLLHELCRRTKWESSAQIARHIGISASSVSQWRHQRTQMSDQFRFEFSRFLVAIDNGMETEKPIKLERGRYSCHDPLSKYRDRVKNMRFLMSVKCAADIGRTWDMIPLEEVLRGDEVSAVVKEFNSYGIFLMGDFQHYTLNELSAMRRVGKTTIGLILCYLEKASATLAPNTDKEITPNHMAKLAKYYLENPHCHRTPPRHMRLWK